MPQRRAAKACSKGVPQRRAAKACYKGVLQWHDPNFGMIFGVGGGMPELWSDQGRGARMPQLWID